MEKERSGEEQGRGKVQALRRVVAGTAALAALLGSLAGLWLMLAANAEMRLSGETLSNYARRHPPKPWRGFDVDILNVAVDGEVHIKAHISGHLIHTPVEISGVPEYDANARAIFLHVSKARLPRDAERPILSRFNAMLNPLATYIAKNVADVIPAKRIREETASGAMFLTTVRSVRVDGDAVVLTLHGYRVASAAAALLVCVVLSGFLLVRMAVRMTAGGKR